MVYGEGPGFFIPNLLQPDLCVKLKWKTSINREMEKRNWIGN